MLPLCPCLADGPGAGRFSYVLLSNCGARHALPDLPGIAPALSREVLFAEARGASPPLVVLMSVEPEVSLRKPYRRDCPCYA